MAGRIYICDDEFDIAETLSDLLVRARYETKFFVTGQELLQAVASERPELAIVDCNMPMHGIRALAELRKIASKEDLPVIMMSGNVGEDIIRRAGALGVSGFALKPFEDADILPKVQAALRKRPGQSKGDLAEENTKEFVDSLLASISVEDKDVGRVTSVGTFFRTFPVRHGRRIFCVLLPRFAPGAAAGDRKQLLRFAQVFERRCGAWTLCWSSAMDGDLTGLENILDDDAA